MSISVHLSQKMFLWTYFDDVVNVDLPVFVVIEGLSDPLQLVLRNILDLPHDANQLVDAD